MLQQPLPTCDEFDPLDAHLDDLEQPGTYFLQDIMSRPPPAATIAGNDTPMSGYTSEESDYSVATTPSTHPQQHPHPTEEQMFQDMSFLQSANTDELVDAVADFCTDDLTQLSPQQQQKFAGKMIKGKTSKYRGVTQTSKTSWGAKYSAKRITNTCKTPDEAARAYDQYLKTYYPQKYSKFANFCDKCDGFVNPLGLPEFQSECTCSPHHRAARSPGGSSSGGSTPGGGSSMEMDVMVSTPPARSQYNQQQAIAGGVSPANMPMSFQPPNPAEDDESTGENLRVSNLSVGSLKFSFSDDNAQFLEETFDAVKSLAAEFGNDQSIQQPPQQQQQNGNSQRDSLPMAVISSAVESFTQEDNLDAIIKDINRSSSSNSFSKHHSFSDRLPPPNVEPTSTGGSTSVDFSMDELQDLSEYLLSDHGGIPVVVTANVDSTSSANNSAIKQAGFHKAHSLDFDSNDVGMIPMDIKQEPVMMDVNGLDSYMQSMGGPMVTGVPIMATPAPAPFVNTYPAVIEIQTPFLDKYWRNDRKNIQCFPYCPEHGDYYRVRIENLQHRCKGVCRAAVKARIMIPNFHQRSQSGLHVFARCNSTFSRNEVLTAQASLNLAEIKALQSLSAVGVIDKFAPSPDDSGVQFDVTFYPDVWKFEFDLPKKRRHVQANGAPMEPDIDNLGAEFLYFFEIDVFYSRDKMTFERLGHTESVNFQIGNTRTLLRQRNKMVEDNHVANDGDTVLDVDALPEKKKIKMYRGQLAHSITSMTDDDPSLISKDKQFVALDEGGYDRMESKDSNFYDLDKDRRSSAEWRDDGDTGQDDDQASVTNYSSHVTPKQKGRLLAGEKHTIDIPSKESQPSAAKVKDPTVTSNHPVPTSNTHQSHTHADESYSFSKLFTYTVVCLPLSIIMVPVGLVLLLAFLVLPFTAGSIVKVLDGLSDSELRRANSSAIATDTRLVLNRLEMDLPQAGKSSKLFRYHSQGAVWTRFVYFSIGKLLISVLALVPTMLLAGLAFVTYPIRPLSKILVHGSCACALWTREYTRKSVGKPLTPVAQYEPYANLV